MKKITCLLLSVILSFSIFMGFCPVSYAENTSSSIVFVDPTEYLDLDEMSFEAVLKCSVDDICSYIDACRVANNIPAPSTENEAIKYSGDAEPLWGSNWEKKEDVTKTHEMMAFASVCLMFSEKQPWSTDFLQAIADAGIIAAYSAEPDDWKNEANIPAFVGHFYDPDTGKSYVLGSTITAKTNIKKYYDKAVKAIKSGNLDKGLKYFGYALHFLQDINQPHHAANIVVGEYNDVHKKFETYVDNRLDTIASPIIEDARTTMYYSWCMSKSVEEILIKCAHISKSKASLINDGNDSSNWLRVATEQLTNTYYYSAAFTYKFAKDSNLI